MNRRLFLPRYRRAHTPGACYFFTVVAYRRQSVLCDDDGSSALRDAIMRVRETRPFAIDAWLLLPDHLHFRVGTKIVPTLPSLIDWAGCFLLDHHCKSMRLPHLTKVMNARI